MSDLVHRVLVHPPGLVRIGTAARLQDNHIGNARGERLVIV